MVKDYSGSHFNGRSEQQWRRGFMKDNRAIAHGKVRRLATDVLLIALVCLASTLASHVASAASNGHQRYLVLGTIENIDSAANTITVRLSDGTDKTLPLAKRITVNGRGETRSRAESSLTAQERAVIYYTDNSGDETAVDVESLSHAMPRTVTGTFISGDRVNKTVVMRTANGKEETFRVQDSAVIETGDSVMTFAQFEPQSGAQITLHYDDPLGVEEVSRIKH
jgi:hypothetical protein